jgi:hypothetical protein
VAVTVTVCAVLVAAGAVYVAEVVVVFDRAPPPLTLHDTPSVPLSLATVADSVTVSVPSTVVTEAVTATVGAFELPPQPDRVKVATKAITNAKNDRLVLRPEGTILLLSINASKNCNKSVWERSGPQSMGL